MEKRIIELDIMQEYRQYLIMEEKSKATLEKYCRDLQAFAEFADGGEITKELTLAYKQQLVEKGYAVRSINSVIASLNSFFCFMGWQDCRVKSLRLQRQIYCREEKELTRAEYDRLISAAENQPRLQLIMKTICATGIRVSELEYFTMEAIRCGEVTIFCKNKTRKILLPGKLKKLLMRYAAHNGIKKGVIFRTRSGKPLDRSNIWSMMKSLCKRAKVDPQKVYPHNLRKLFARVFYKVERDIAKLADILGHSSINTTRIYIISTGKEHMRVIERLGLTG